MTVKLPTAARLKLPRATADMPQHMATVEKSRSDDWKDKYFKALNELDDQERLRAEKVGRVSRDLLTVLQHFRGANTAFDNDLELLCKSDKLFDDGQQSRLRGLVSTLSRIATPALTGAAPPIIVAPSPAPPADTAAPLRTLLGLLQVPSRMRPVIDALAHRLDAVDDADLPLISAIAAQLSVILGEAGEDRTLAARDALQTLIDHLSLPSAAQARLGAITPKLQQAADAAAVKAIAKDLANFVVEYVAKLHSEVAGLNSFLMVIKPATR